MATLYSTNNIPPGGWRYLQPGTNVWFRETSLDLMVSKIQAHRAYKGIEPGDPLLDIQRQICLSMVNKECRPEPGETYNPTEDQTHSLTTAKVLSLSKALIKFATSDLGWVEPDERERRAEICRGCPFNKPAILCSCSTAYKVINAVIPEHRVPEGVDVCMACGCSLKAKLNLPMDVIKASIAPGQTFPEYCWQREALKSIE